MCDDCTYAGIIFSLVIAECVENALCNLFLTVLRTHKCIISRIGNESYLQKRRRHVRCPKKVEDILMDPGIVAFAVRRLVDICIIFSSEQKAVLIIGHPKKIVADDRLRSIRVEILI